jgi:hypothetical protein
MRVGKLSTSTEPLVRFEQRQGKRVSTLKKGRIVFNNGHSVVDCTVRNTSETGAGLELPCHVELPGTITLVIEGGAKRECDVVWSANNKLGVTYIDASLGRQAEGPRHLLLRRVRSIEEQLDELRSEIETTLAP